MPQDDKTDLAIRDDNPRELVTSVDTKESKIAGYLSSWKTKIETIGIKYFPDEAMVAGVTGSPTLEVTINASGQLEQALVRRSSGSRALDQIALSILRRAAPFDPFPEAIRVDYDQLRFAYKWQFNHLDRAVNRATQLVIAARLPSVSQAVGGYLLNGSQGFAKQPAVDRHARNGRSEFHHHGDTRL